MALAAHGIDSDVPTPVELTEDAELAETTKPAVRLSGLSDIQRVNALGSGPLRLTLEGINVIYGGNATGKSGLARILKKTCQSRDPGGPILPNIFEEDPQQPAAAKIDFMVEDEAFEVNWTDGTPADSRLRSINVFDSRCAAVQVERANRITYTPRILQLFGDLAQAVDGVAAKLREQIVALGEVPPEITALQLTEGTETEKFLSGLSKESRVETLESLCEITDADLDRLAELDRALSIDPVTGAESKEMQVQNLQELQDAVDSINDHLGSEACRRYEILIAERTRTKKIAEAARIAFEGNSDLAGFGTEEWCALWKAARLFSESHAYPNAPFPAVSEGKQCVLCQQQLASEARRRIQSFEDFVQAEAQKTATSASETVDGLLLTLSTMPLPKDVRRKVKEAGQAKTEVGEALRRFLVVAKIRRRQVVQLAADVGPDPRPGLPGKPILTMLIDGISSDALQLRRASENEERKKMVDERERLKDRITVADHVDAMKVEITRLKTLAKYQAALDDCKTQPITRKRRVAADIVLTGRLQAAFLKNLLSLGFGGSPVEYSLGAGEHGDHPVEMKLTPRPEVGLAEVLSEGERTCVALAGLLAELETTGSRSALVLDDPVTSLDHQYRKRVAERLLREATTRQVVVLTHDIVFLFLLRKYQADLKVPMIEASLHKGYRGDHGRVTEGPPWEAMYVKDRIKRLRADLDHARRALKDEGRQAYEGHAGEIYKNLRMCWERAVEEVLLNQTVLRFGDSIQTRRLAKLVDIAEADIGTIDREMGRCSDFEHDESGAVKADLPEPDIILEDIGRLDEWVKDLRRTRGRS